MNLSSVKKPAFQAHTHWERGAPTRLLLVRHGETRWNVRRVIQGWKGSGLNVVGRRQAELTALRVRRLGLRIEAVLSSDLPRSLQTAEVLAQNCRVPLLVRREWRERNFGEWEGKSISQVLRKYRLGPKQRCDPFLAFEPKRGESMAVFTRRIGKALDLAEAEFRGCDVAVVTHGGPMRIAACLVAGISPRRYFLLGRPANSALTLIGSQGGVRWVEFYNDAAHLEGQD